MDSVNAVSFQPYTHNLVTGSGDKTVSLWDIRTGLCTQTFYGHRRVPGTGRRPPATGY